MSARLAAATNRRDFLGTLSAGVLVASAAGERVVSADDKPSGGSPPPRSSSDKPPLAPPDKQPPNLELPTVVKRKAGWAIVGLGELALGEIMPAFGECQYAKPTALVSGHPDKAKRVAEAYGIDTKSIYNYENYDDLRRNDEVDVIYIVLPNSMHAEYTIRGLKAGKHVFCEKPMSVTVDEAEKMIATAEQTGKKLAIAYRLRYEPFNRKAIEICLEKRLGKLKLFYGSHGQNVPAPNIRLSKELGGGPVGDVGVYCINAARYLSGEEPIEVTAMAHWPEDDSRFREVPESVVFTLRFPSGFIAHGDCSFGITENRHYRLICEQGTIDLDPAFSYFGLKMRLNDGQGPQEMNLKPANHFAAEMDHFSQCVLENKDPLTPGSEGLADMKIIVAIEEAARTGKTVKLGEV